jgi:hypothetical protein
LNHPGRDITRIGGNDADRFCYFSH